MNRSIVPASDGMQLACLFLGRVLLDPPTSAFMQALKEDRLCEAWPVTSQSGNDFWGLQQLREAVFACDTKTVPSLENDFLRLFIGLPHPLAPPYESVYLGKDHLLCEQPMLAVRQAYQQNGFVLAKTIRLPDDHIGLQLCFVAHLLGGQAQDPRRSTPQVHAALGGFLSNHLSLWIADFAQKVETHAHTSFYVAIAKLTLQMIGELKNSRVLDPASETR